MLQVIENLRRRGYRSIRLSGDSAGGNLSAAAALKLRSQIAGIILYYPVTLVKADGSDSWKRYNKGYGLDGDLMVAFNDAYLQGQSAGDPFVSPLLAKEFWDYPKTLVIAADHDILFDQGKQFVEVLKNDAIDAAHVTVQGSIHAFLTYPDMDQAYRRGLDEAVRFLTDEP